MDKNFFIQSYFGIQYLKLFYSKKPKDIDNFYKKIKEEICNNTFRDICMVKGFEELINKYKQQFQQDKFREIKSKILPSIPLQIYFKNLILYDKFIKSKNLATDRTIKEFLIKDWKVLRYLGILSTHEFYLNSNYFKEKGQRWIIISEPKEFIELYFEELFLNDYGYALGIFIFLDLILKSSNLKFFKKVHDIGRKLLDTKISDTDLNQVIRYQLEKDKNQGL